MKRLLLMALPIVLFAQVDFQQKGYIDFRGFTFPQTTYNDSGHVIGEALIRYDVIMVWRQVSS